MMFDPYEAKAGKYIQPLRYRMRCRFAKIPIRFRIAIAVIGAAVYTLVFLWGLAAIAASY